MLYLQQGPRTLMSKLQSVLARSERLIRAIQGLLSRTGTLRFAHASSGSDTCMCKGL